MWFFKYQKLFAANKQTPNYTKWFIQADQSYCLTLSSVHLVKSPAFRCDVELQQQAVKVNPQGKEQTHPVHWFWTDG